MLPTPRTPFLVTFLSAPTPPTPRQTQQVVERLFEYEFSGGKLLSVTSKYFFVIVLLDDKSNNEVLEPLPPDFELEVSKTFQAFPEYEHT